MEPLTEWLKILIFNYPSVKPSITRHNKKHRIHNFTTDMAPFFFFFFFPFPICKKHQYPFISLIFSHQLLLFSSMLRYVFFFFSFFFFLVFLINILYEFFFSLLSFTCNHIKVRFFFHVFFSLYLLFYFIFNCFCS